ncbi:extensin-like [Macadamia integrifolia]|uniref:extensin-like n=1 Tax=Macadamia integrifolia TaxID=60698 RepID=UPI001C4E67E7|nr:extensin-like [Macadamia integrifolia]
MSSLPLPHLPFLLLGLLAAAITLSDASRPLSSSEKPSFISTGEPSLFVKQPLINEAPISRKQASSLYGKPPSPEYKPPPVKKPPPPEYKPPSSTPVYEKPPLMIKSPPPEQKPPKEERLATIQTEASFHGEATSAYL